MVRAEARLAASLYEEDVASADGLFVGYGELSVAELSDLQLSERASQALADFLCEVSRGCTREDHEGVLIVHYI